MMVPRSLASCLPISKASDDCAVLSTPRVVPAAPARAMISEAFPLITHGFILARFRIVCAQDPLNGGPRTCHLGCLGDLYLCNNIIDAERQAAYCKHKGLLQSREMTSSTRNACSKL